MKLLLTSDTRQVDAATCQAQGITMLQLMERAAGRAATAIIERYGDQRGWRKVHVFIGPGNNGGDARIIGQRLSDHGFKVLLYDFSHPDVFPQQALEIEREDLIIDGLFGAGLNRPITGGYAYLVRLINDSCAEVVSIDIPSGLSGESNAGADPLAIVHADLTLSFTCPKLSMLLPDSARYVGEMQIIDIGIPSSILDQTSSSHYLITHEQLRNRYRKRSRFSHKGTYGNAWLAAGSKGMMGAALLAARAAMRGGTGLLTVHIPSCGYDIMQSGIPEAKCDTDTHRDHLSVLAPASSYNALAIGPGIGQSSDTALALGLLLERDGRPLVLDADALNLLSLHPEWLRKVKPGSILTPHPREADRLLVAAWKSGLLDAVPGARMNYGPTSAAAAALSGANAAAVALSGANATASASGGTVSSLTRLLTLRVLAEKLQSVIILKGTYTAVCCPNGQIWWQYLHGNPGMAVGGSGDTLTGLLLALVAQRYSPVDAAIIGVSVHALAADIAVERGESYESLLPSNVIQCFGAAFRRLF